MKLLLISLVTLNMSLAAQAENIVATYNCILSSSKPTDSDFRKQAFPLILTTDGYEAAEDMGSSEIYQLTKMTADELAQLPKGLPQYEGTYYTGNDDLFVITSDGGNVKVVRPYDVDINTQEGPASYNCAKTM